MFHMPAILSLSSWDRSVRTGSKSLWTPLEALSWRLLFIKLKPHIHIATDCNAMSQVQSQPISSICNFSTSMLRCISAQLTSTQKYERRKIRFHMFLYLQLANPKYTHCNDLQHDISSLKNISQCQITATDCKWPPYMWQQTATRRSLWINIQHSGFTLKAQDSSFKYLQLTGVWSAEYLL